MSWKSQKRDAKRREWAEQSEREEIERNRKASLSWYEKIEECEDIHDLKAVLHEMAEQLELDR